MLPLWLGGMRCCQPIWTGESTLPAPLWGSFLSAVHFPCLCMQSGTQKPKGIRQVSRGLSALLSHLYYLALKFLDALAFSNPSPQICKTSEAHLNLSFLRCLLDTPGHALGYLYNLLLFSFSWGSVLCLTLASVWELVFILCLSYLLLNIWD